MLWIKALHIIALVAWFSGLFYLPRLFVYHATWNDAQTNAQFKVMERKLYYYITTPAAILTLIFGVWVMSYNFRGYLQQPWMHIKLSLVFLLVLYHGYLGKLLSNFQHNKNSHSARFYRWLNELPTVFLVLIVCLVVVKPVF